jgi:SAM-dependent methyltransferase
MIRNLKTLFQSFYRPFVPPILNPIYFRELKNKIFYKDKITHRFDYEENFYTRHAFINKAIMKYKDCNYLEIGVASNSVFNSIPLENDKKFGVDPLEGGNYRMTSDEFFQTYNNLKFDVIFIDGLHHYEQCQKDCLNSIKSLKDGGIILFHDLLPRSPFEENVPQKHNVWTGDVWKVAVELANSENADFKIVNIDMGIGILKINKNFEYKKLDNLKNEDFFNFLEYKKRLPIISSEQGFKFITQ